MSVQLNHSLVSTASDNRRYSYFDAGRGRMKYRSLTKIRTYLVKDRILENRNEYQALQKKYPNSTLIKEEINALSVLERLVTERCPRHMSSRKYHIFSKVLQTSCDRVNHFTLL